jgi:hypothetical protein
MVKQSFLQIPGSTVLYQAEVGEGGSMFQGYSVTGLQGCRPARLTYPMLKVNMILVGQAELQNYRV